MQSPTEGELEESIKELSEYKNRLEEEVVTISQKLKMPSTKIKSIINSHQELNQIKIILSKLNKQKACINKNSKLWIYFDFLNKTKMNSIKIEKIKLKLIY